jgi:hypothetical protein
MLCLFQSISKVKKEETHRVLMGWNVAVHWISNRTRTLSQARSFFSGVEVRLTIGLLMFHRTTSEDNWATSPFLFAGALLQALLQVEYCLCHGQL